MIPTRWSNLAMAGKTADQAVLLYFLSQYPDTTNCAELNSQILQIQSDINNCNSAQAGIQFIMRNDPQGVIYLKAYANLVNAKITVKRNALTTCSNTAPTPAQTPIVSGNPGTSSSSSSTTTPIPAGSTVITPNPTVLVSDLTSQSSTVSNTPPNTNQPNGGFGFQSGGGGGSSSSGAPTTVPGSKDYFSKKNLLIGGAVLLALAVIGTLVFSKKKKNHGNPTK